MENNLTTYQQHAYQFIKDRIVNLGFKPGEYLTDTQIAGQLGVSRTPVREAFHRLEKEGLLDYEARKGWMVYVLTLEDIQDIFDLKVVIEGMVVRKASQCQDDQLRERLLQALVNLEKAASSHDLDAWMSADVCLHDIIFSMAGNERARNIILNLNDQWHRVNIGFVARTGGMQRSANEHREFVQAILERNAEEAESLFKDHINHLRDELVNLLTTMVLPFVDKGI